MSFFLTYAADSEEYLLKPAGYGLLIILLAALLFVIYKLGKVSLKTQKMQTKQLVTCSAAMALAVVTSYIKVLQFLIEPYIFAPLQVLLDYPMAFAGLGLAGLFSSKKHGLITGYLFGIFSRYICHVLSGYIFFAAYAPEGMNPFLYTLGYNATYIVPEAIATVVILSLPPVAKAIAQVKKQAISS